MARCELSKGVAENRLLSNGQLKGNAPHLSNFEGTQQLQSNQNKLLMNNPLSYNALWQFYEIIRTFLTPHY